MTPGIGLHLAGEKALPGWGRATVELPFRSGRPEGGEDSRWSASRSACAVGCYQFGPRARANTVAFGVCSEPVAFVVTPPICADRIRGLSSGIARTTTFRLLVLPLSARFCSMLFVSQAVSGTEPYLEPCLCQGIFCALVVSAHFFVCGDAPLC